jgi:hypothetical protein
MAPVEDVVEEREEKLRVLKAIWETFLGPRQMMATKESAVT